MNVSDVGIGEPQREWEIEPIEVPTSIPVEEPMPVPMPEREPELVPA